MKGEYLVGEPLILTAGVSNTGSETRAVLDLLDPAYGFLNVEIKRPGSSVFEPFRPAVGAAGR
jgi:hypothetical protein